MADLAAERVFTGLSAADGLAIGNIVIERAAGHGSRQTGSPAEERTALDAAIVQAKREVDALAAKADDLGAEILEFQSALLEDEDLLDLAFERLSRGISAHDAWSAAIDGEVTEYRAGGDDYFKARAEDLLDLKARVLKSLFGDDAEAPPTAIEDAILLAEDLTPSRFLELGGARLRGAAVRGGSPTSHVAILARARGIPLVVGLDAVLDDALRGKHAVLDAKAGRLVIAPSDGTMAAAKGRLESIAADRRAWVALIDRPAVTSGGEAVQVLLNLDDPAILDTLSPAHSDGIGLTRTEFLFRGGHLPDEDTQFKVYRRLVAWAAGRPVTIRTLDAGGDKPIPGVTPSGESNPFLGIRGLRLSLRQPEIFAVQLRALARAAALGPLKVMMPMVTVPAEMAQVQRILDEVLAGLAKDGVDHARPALGMMIEVPAAALTAASFEVDFFSIGSNDLVQYLTASARDNAAVAPLADPRNPAVIETIRRCVAAARAKEIEISLCGDMASDPDLLPLLLDCGLRSVSVAPAQLGAAKLAIHRYRAEVGRDG